MNINEKYRNITINLETNPNRKRENSEASEKDLDFRDKFLKKFTDREKDTKNNK